MSDGPAGPMERLMTRRLLAFQNGKHFDENSERRAIGLPVVPNGEVIEESAARKRAVLLDDESYQAELETYKKQASDAQAEEMEKNAVIRSQANEIANLRAELMRARNPFNIGGNEKVESKVSKSPTPDIDWSRTALIQYLEDNGLAPLPPGFQNKSKAHVLEHVLEQQAKAAGVGPPIPGLVGAA